MQTKDISELKAELSDLLKQEALKKGNFVLSSGKTSTYYLDGRVITLSPKGAYLAASIILDMIKDKGAQAIGGPTLGADPIVGAIACLSHINNVPINTFIVRKAAKEHGAGRQVEGPAIKKGSKVILIDDVATTGKALIEAKQALDCLGVIVIEALTIVDRCEGAEENLKKAGIKLKSIFKISELGI